VPANARCFVYYYYYYYCYYHIRLTAFFQDNLGRPTPEGKRFF